MGHSRKFKKYWGFVNVISIFRSCLVDINLPHRRGEVTNASGRHHILPVQELLRLLETNYEVRRCALLVPRHHTHAIAGLPRQRGNFHGGDVDDEDPERRRFHGNCKGDRINSGEIR